MSVDTVRTEAPVDAWEIRHAALATWKATSHLSRTIAELERLEETRCVALLHRLGRRWLRCADSGGTSTETHRARPVLTRH